MKRKREEEIIKKESPDAILPTLGGQTGLNTVLELSKSEIIDQFNIKIIGANIASIRKAESRNKFKLAIDNIGLKTTKSKTAKNLNQAKRIANEIGFPLVIRTSFTMGGSGSKIIYNMNQ